MVPNRQNSFGSLDQTREELGSRHPVQANFYLLLTETPASGHWLTLTRQPGRAGADDFTNFA